MAVRSTRRDAGRASLFAFALSCSLAFASAAGTTACKREVENASTRGRATPRSERAASREGAADADRTSAPDDAAAPVTCTPDPAFAADWPIEEASAAVDVPVAIGAAPRALVVTSDSGNHGALLVIPFSPDGAPPPLGDARRETLPLDDAASDDLEGMAWREGALYTLTSSGAVRRFVPDGRGGFARDGAAYPIAPPPLSCPRLTDVNCGKNYEGLCLRGASVTARCAGYAASKRDGSLHCLVLEEKKLRIDPVKPPIKLALPESALADCAFGTEGGPAERTLVITTNVHNGSKTYVVDEASGALERLEVPGHVNNEAVAIDGRGTLYQFQDDGRAPSAGSRATCSGW